MPIESGLHVAFHGNPSSVLRHRVREAADPVSRPQINWSRTKERPFHAGSPIKDPLPCADATRRGATLGKRRRRWPNVDPPSGQRLNLNSDSTPARIAPKFK